MALRDDLQTALVEIKDGPIGGPPVTSNGELRIIQLLKECRDLLQQLVVLNQPE